MIQYSFFLLIMSWMNSIISIRHNVTLLRNYDIKVCRNEPSCHLLKEGNLPPNRHILGNRGCMCDADCVKYRDCCTDSQHYKEEEQIIPQSFHCPTMKKVYVKITCPVSWSDENIAQQCRKSVLRLQSEDIYQIIPVTDTETNITYGNKYCAVCHGRDNYKFWKIVKYCGEAPPGFVKNVDAPTLLQSGTRTIRAAKSDLVSLEPHTRYRKVHRTPTEVGSDFINALLRYARRKRETKIVVNFFKHAKKIDEIWNGTKYDSNSGYFISKYENKDFICEVTAKLPSELFSHTRICVPNMIENCIEKVDEVIVHGCKNHTAIVYNRKDNKVYRNKFCALCNKVAVDNLTGCPIMTRDESP